MFSCSSVVLLFHEDVPNEDPQHFTGFFTGDVTSGCFVAAYPLPGDALANAARWAEGHPDAYEGTTDMENIMAEHLMDNVICSEDVTTHLEVKIVKTDQKDVKMENIRFGQIQVQNCDQGCRDLRSPQHQPGAVI